MAETTGRRSRAGFASTRMPDGFRFPGSICMTASAFAMNTTLPPVGNWTSGSRGACLLIRVVRFRHAPPEDCCGARDSLERLDRHRYPFEDLAVMADAVQRLLDSNGD